MKNSYTLSLDFDEHTSAFCPGFAKIMLPSDLVSMLESAKAHAATLDVNFECALVELPIDAQKGLVYIFYDVNSNGIETLATLPDYDIDITISIFDGELTIKFKLDCGFYGTLFATLD